jgi:hypothetical protein
MFHWDTEDPESELPIGSPCMCGETEYMGEGEELSMVEPRVYDDAWKEPDWGADDGDDPALP